MDCIFCSLNNQNPQNKVSENNTFYSLLDLNPVSNGHCIIIPKRHIESYFDLNIGEVSDLQNMLVGLKNMIKEKLHPDGYNIGVNDGEAAGSTVKHLLIHMIPRYNGDVPSPAGGIRNILGVPMEAPKPVIKEEPKPEPKKEEKKPEPKKEEPKKPKTWQELLEENKKKARENEIMRVRDKFK